MWGKAQPACLSACLPAGPPPSPPLSPIVAFSFSFYLPLASPSSPPYAPLQHHPRQCHPSRYPARPGPLAGRVLCSLAGDERLLPPSLSLSPLFSLSSLSLSSFLSLQVSLSFSPSLPLTLSLSPSLSLTPSLVLSFHLSIPLYHDLISPPAQARLVLEDSGVRADSPAGGGGAEVSTPPFPPTPRHPTSLPITIPATAIRPLSHPPHAPAVSRCAHCGRTCVRPRFAVSRAAGKGEFGYRPRPLGRACSGGESGRDAADGALSESQCGSDGCQPLGRPASSGRGAAPFCLLLDAPDHCSAFPSVRGSPLARPPPNARARADAQARISTHSTHAHTHTHTHGRCRCTRRCWRRPAAST